MSEDTNQKSLNHDALVLYVDGASFGNPGPAGAAFVLEAAEGELKRASIPLGTCTNNEAEYRALIAGLYEAAARRARRIIIRSDSQLLIRQMRGEYKVKAKNLQPLHKWAQKVARRFEHVCWQHIPREQNALADALAKQAAERSRRHGSQ